MARQVQILGRNGKKHPYQVGNGRESTLGGGGGGGFREVERCGVAIVIGDKVEVCPWLREKSRREKREREALKGVRGICRGRILVKSRRTEGD